MKKINVLVAIVLVCSMMLGVNTPKASSESDCDWPMFGRTPEGNRVVQLCDDIGDIVLYKWQLNVESNIISSSVIKDNKLYILVGQSILKCIDIYTGKIIWQTQSGKTINSAPIITNSGSNKSTPTIYKNNIYYAANDGVIYCINLSTGIKVWEYKTEDGYFCSPIIVNDRLYIGGADRYVYCIDAVNGFKIWSRYVSYIVKDNIAMFENKIFIPLYGSLLCLNSSNGDVIWDFNTINSFTDTYSPVVFSYNNNGHIQNRIYFGNSSDFYCLNIDKMGELVWHKSCLELGEIKYAPIITQENVYIGSSNGCFYSLDQDGEKRWIFKTNNWISSAAIKAYDKIIFGSSDTYLYCLNSNSGEKLWEYFSGQWITGAPVIFDNLVIFGCENNKLTCLETKNCNWTMIGRQSDNNRLVPENCSILFNFLRIESELQISRSKLIGSPLFYKGSFYLVNDLNEILCIKLGSKNSYEINWVKSINDVISKIVIYNDNLYFHNNRNCYCLSASTGNILWETKIFDEDDLSSITVNNNRVLLGSLNNKKLICLDAINGKIIWQFNAEGKIIATPASVNDRIVVGNFDNLNNYLFCLNINNGNEYWRINMTHGFFGSSVINNKQIYVGSLEGCIYCINLLNGEIVWRFETVNYVDTFPVVDKYMFINAKDFITYSFDKSNGKVLWKVSPRGDPYKPELPSKPILVGPLILSSNFIISLMSDGSIILLDQKKGNIKSIINGSFYEPPILVNNRIYAINSDGKLVVINTYNNIVMTVNNTDVKVNNINYVLKIAPTIIKNTTLVPLRFIGDTFGCNIDWESSTKKITMTGDKRKIELWIGKTTANVNNKPMKLSVPPTIIKGTTMVPLRFISEAFGAKVNYDAKTKVIDIEWQPSD